MASSLAELQGLLLATTTKLNTANEMIEYLKSERDGWRDRAIKAEETLVKRKANGE